MVKKIQILNRILPKSKPDSKYLHHLVLLIKMIKDNIEKEILREYYSFLYDLASKKNYLHASQLTDEEKKYCDKLLSGCKTNIQSNEMDMPLMKNILLHHYSSTNG